MNVRLLACLVGGLLLVELLGPAAVLGQSGGELPDGCPRGDAEPWFEGESIPRMVSRSFDRESRIAAAEVVRLEMGESFRITSSGCEYYSVEIRYDFPDGIPAGASAAFWIEKGVRALMTLDAWGGGSVFDLELAAATLAALPPAASSFEVFVPVEGDGEDFLQTQLSIRSAADAQRFVEIVLSKGPL